MRHLMSSLRLFVIAAPIGCAAKLDFLADSPFERVYWLQREKNPFR